MMWSDRWVYTTLYTALWGWHVFQFWVYAESQKDVCWGNDQLEQSFPRGWGTNQKSINQTKGESKCQNMRRTESLSGHLLMPKNMHNLEHARADTCIMENMKVSEGQTRVRWHTWYAMKHMSTLCYYITMWDSFCVTNYRTMSLKSRLWSRAAVTPIYITGIYTKMKIT